MLWTTLLTCIENSYFTTFQPFADDFESVSLHGGEARRGVSENFVAFIERSAKCPNHKSN
jgi:hypothetical protein